MLRAVTKLVAYFINRDRTANMISLFCCILFKIIRVDKNNKPRFQDHPNRWSYKRINSTVENSDIHKRIRCAKTE